MLTPAAARAESMEALWRGQQQESIRARRELARVTRERDDALARLAAVHLVLDAYNLALEAS